MSILSWIILIVYATLVIGTMVAILLDNRQPVKTMAWLMVLVFVPLVGVILYFFFGQNVRKERLISQRSLDKLTKNSMLGFVEQKGLKVPEEYENLVRLFVNQNMSLPFSDNEVEIYTQGEEFFDALLTQIAQARHHVHLQTYIIEDDSLGQRVAQALIAKAREGVEVRLVYDDVGCWKVPSRFFRQMTDAGVRVESFMPVRFPAFTSKVNYRNHRKLCIIDGQVGFIGGMNIAERYLSWRDTHLRVRGGLVYGLQRAFLMDWYFASRSLITDKAYYPVLKALPVPQAKCCQGVLGQIVTSSPISPWPEIMQGYVQILQNARHYVYMETPYYLPTEQILFAMRTAVLSGVDVRLMVPLTSDAKVVRWASRSYLAETISAGVKVYMYRPVFNHSKLLVADDTLCTCGSTNVDFRSFENNFEANVFFYHRELALRFKEVFLNDQHNSMLINGLTDLANRPFHKRLWESLVRLLSPLL